MTFLPGLSRDNENSMEIPEDYKVCCGECDWKGKYSDCPSIEESEGWEYPTYMVPVCPKCEAGVEI